MNKHETILKVDSLTTEFRLRDGVLKAVDRVSFEAQAGKVLCIVGESGCGKSVTAHSLMQLIDKPGEIVGGSISFRGRNLLNLSEQELENEIRGNKISMIFQDPMTSLNPCFTVGEQILESIMTHQDIDEENAKVKVIELLGLVGIPQPEQRYDEYPHNFSGGMRQRVMIALAVACEPDILIADEPTTALDVTIQAQILHLLNDLQKKLHNSLIMITHDLGVVASIADEVIVMYCGRIIERGDVYTIFKEPKHPYTKGLIESVIRLDDSKSEELSYIKGSSLMPLNKGVGCPFRDRCKESMNQCYLEDPELVVYSENHEVACHVVKQELVKG